MLCVLLRPEEDQSIWSKRQQGFQPCCEAGIREPTLSDGYTKVDIPCAIISSPRPPVGGTVGIVYTDLCTEQGPVMANKTRCLLKYVYPNSRDMGLACSKTIAQVHSEKRARMSHTSRTLQI